MNLNSDHYPVTLHIPYNTLIATPPTPTNILPNKILNPIPPENLKKFNIIFFEENSTQLNELTTLLENHQYLNPDQWQKACTSLDNIINKISETIEKTCKAAPLPNLTYRTSHQGGFLPRKLAKEWKKYLTTYHIIRKTIYIIQHDLHWQTHPILNEIRNHQYVNIPHPPTTTTSTDEWIDAIAVIAKTTNKEARKITTKYTKDCILKAVSKYRKMYENSPKKINRKNLQKLRNLTTGLHPRHI